MARDTATEPPNAGPRWTDTALVAAVCGVVVVRVFSDMSLLLPVARLCIAAIVVLAVVHVAVGVGQGRLAAARPMLLVPAGAFLAVGVVSVFRAGHAFAAWDVLLHFLGGLLVFVLLAGLGARPQHRAFVTAVLVGTAVVAAGLGVDQYRGGLGKAEGMAKAAAERVRSREFQANLQGRLHDRRAFGPFDLPNTLAGFMCLALPMLGAGLVCARSGREGLAVKVLLGLCLGVVGAGLLLSFSKAGWLVAAAACVGLAGWMAMGVRRRAGRIAVGSIAVLAAALIASVAMGALPKLRLHRYVWSASARMDYWTAGMRMVRQRPLMGVGLGNFADHFFAHKTRTGEETRYAHNDYLQILAETGAVGLLAFVGLLAAWCWLALPRSRGPMGKPDGQTRAGVGWLACTGAAAFLFLIGPAGAFHPLMLMLLLPLWLVAAAAVWHAAGSREADVLFQAAAFFAAAGVLLHATVDLDLYSRGLSFPLWAAMAIALEPGGRVCYDLRTPVRRAGVWLGVALVLVVCWRPLLRGVRGERALMRADRARTEQDWRGYMDRLAEAVQVAPNNPAVHARLGLLVQMAAREAPGKDERQRAYQAAAGYLAKAIELRPQWSEYRRWLAELYEEAAGADRIALGRALPHARAAVALYPNETHYRVALGRLLYRLGQTRDALTQYRVALEIDQAVREADGPAKMRLDAADRAAVQAKLSPTRKEDSP